jgi:nitrous oxide reductase accessory protein NosL
MFVAKDTQWVAAVVLKDGSRAFFDGPKDMFRYLFEIGKYAKGKSSADVSGVYVTEYYSGRLTAADELYFVVGSDVMGPMGRELVPVKGKTQAETFLKDHKGKKVRQYKEISSADLSTLD